MEKNHVNFDFHFSAPGAVGVIIQRGVKFLVTRKITGNKMFANSLQISVKYTIPRCWKCTKAISMRRTEQSWFVDSDSLPESNDPDRWFKQYRSYKICSVKLRKHLEKNWQKTCRIWISKIGLGANMDYNSKILQFHNIFMGWRWTYYVVTILLAYVSVSLFLSIPYNSSAAW